MIRVSSKISGFGQVTKAMANTRAALVVSNRAVNNLIVAWLRRKNAEEPNRMGGVRTNFWTDVGRSVSKPMVDSPNRVHSDVTHPHFAQKFLGGPIEAKRKKWLTLPANALAYGKPAASFDLAFTFALDPERGNRWRPALVRKSAMKRRRDWISQRRGTDGVVRNIRQSWKLGAGDVMYWLVKRVRQRPWPGCFPPQAQMEAAARDAYSGYLTMLLGRQGRDGSA